MYDSRSNRGFMVMTALALAALAVLISLGSWQVGRLAWKEGLIRDIETRTQAAPIAFAEWLSTKGGEDYWPVTASGRFRHDGERHFFATHNGQSGYFVYTPLETAPGTFVFVNRGFVPFDQKSPESRAEGQITGSVTITDLRVRRFQTSHHGLSRTMTRRKTSSTGKTLRQCRPAQACPKAPELSAALSMRMHLQRRLQVSRKVA